LGGNEDVIQLEDGCLAVRAKYLSLIQGVPFWYTPSVPDHASVLAHVQTVISADLKLHSVELVILEPPRRNRWRVVDNVGGVLISDEDHGDLLEEIGRRERIDQEETIISCLESDDEWSTDEEEQESDSDDDEEA
jgi:hypothetical protein